MTQYLIILLIAVSVLAGSTAAYYKHGYSQALQREAKAEMRASILAEHYIQEKKIQEERVKYINEEYNNSLTSLRSVYERMLAKNKTILPSNPSSPGGANQPTIRFDREPLDRALNDFRREVTKLTREGDECRAALKSAIEWRKEVVRSKH